MKELVVRATLKTDQYFNEGYIHISKELCEGIFTLDYLSLTVLDNKIVVHVSDNTFNSNGNLVRKEKLFFSYYPYDELFIPDDYILHDYDGNTLFLSITKIISDKEDISKILDQIALIRF